MSTQKLFTKNFSLLILGQASSLFGNTILRFALSMYVLEITGSATVFASILAMTMIPTILLSPFGGILADRANRRNIMVMLDFISGVAVLISVFAMWNSPSVLSITALMLVLSVLGAFESPTVQACVPQMQTGDNIIKANAVVSQVAAVAGVVAPIIGSILYTVLGLKLVMIISVFCFLLTAAFECFIKLEYIKRTEKEGIVKLIKSDFKVSMRFIVKEQPGIFKLLILVAVVSFFVMGVVLVGMPYIVRNVLGLSAGYYGVAESACGIAAIIGSIVAGMLITKLKMRKLYLILIIFGIALAPMGIIFLLPVGAIAKYSVVLICVCVGQLLSCVFSVFALSAIQQKTPNEMLGKTMAYISTITMCIQPLGQMLYGVLFDRFDTQIYLIMLPTAAVIALIGLFSKKLFASFDS